MARFKKFSKSLIEHFVDGGGGKQGKLAPTSSCCREITLINVFLVVDVEGKNKEMEGDDLEAITAMGRRVFRYEAVVAATGKFNPKQKLGEGGFGPVFKVSAKGN